MDLVLLMFARSIRLIIGGTGGIPFPWKSIWHVKSPKRVSFLCVLPLGIKSSLIIPIRRSLFSALVLFVYVQ